MLTRGQKYGVKLVPAYVEAYLLANKPAMQGRLRSGWIDFISPKLVECQGILATNNVPYTLASGYYAFLMQCASAYRTWVGSIVAQKFAEYTTIWTSRGLDSAVLLQILVDIFAWSAPGPGNGGSGAKPVAKGSAKVEK